MTQLRYLIPEADAQALWTAKDRIAREIFLADDPVHMHKARFDMWVKAAAAKALELAEERGVDEDVAVEIIVKHLAEIHAAWKAEAIRRHQ